MFRAFLILTAGLPPVSVGSMLEAESCEAVAPKFSRISSTKIGVGTSYMYDVPTPILVEEMRENFGATASQDSASSIEPTLTGGRPAVNMRNALNMALRQEMKRDGKIVVRSEERR